MNTIHTLKKVSTIGGVNLKPSFTPGLRFRKDPVAMRRDTHSIGIILHFLLINVLLNELFFETKAVFIPTTECCTILFFLIFQN